MKYLVAIFMFFPFCLQSQVIKILSFENDTVKIYRSDRTTLREIVSENESLKIYRLDEKQKNVLKNTKFSKYKKQNTEHIQKILATYSSLESTLDSLANDNALARKYLVTKANEELKLIEHYLGSDKPNGKELSEEYNYYANRYNTWEALQSRKKYVEDVLKSTVN